MKAFLLFVCLLIFETMSEELTAKQVWSRAPPCVQNGECEIDLPSLINWYSELNAIQNPDENLLELERNIYLPMLQKRDLTSGGLEFLKGFAEGIAASTLEGLENCVKATSKTLSLMAKLAADWNKDLGRWEVGSRVSSIFKELSNAFDKCQVFTQILKKLTGWGIIVDIGRAVWKGDVFDHTRKMFKYIRSGDAHGTGFEIGKIAGEIVAKKKKRGSIAFECAPPANWTCDPNYYAANDGCDCECGAFDPDCGTSMETFCWDTIYNVQNQSATCDANNSCIIRHVPNEWSCLLDFYNTSDGCDCNCGIPDPDCDIPGALLFGCSNDAICMDGECIRQTNEVPANWICDPDFYNADDGCHCACGVPDPDCESEFQPTMNCPCVGMVCSATNDNSYCDGDCKGFRYGVTALNEDSSSAANFLQSAWFPRPKNKI